MIVRRVQGQGAGLLHAKFEALKRKLEREGLFDSQRKRTLPRFPVRVGLVTSASGAAIRDMLQVLRRRAPWISVLLAPARVQGEGASDDLIRGLRWLDDAEAMGLPPVDLIILGRGGGSLEDLWPFNEEAVARAIVECRLPVVSAVGHEIDFTISDFVADLRAPTPSAAAELVAPDRLQLLEEIRMRRTRLSRALQHRMERERLRLDRLSSERLRREPVRRLEENRQRLDLVMDRVEGGLDFQMQRSRERLRGLRQRLKAQAPANRLREARERILQARTSLDGAVRRALEKKAEKLARQTGMLRLLGPQRVLERGYSLTLDAEHRLVSSVEGLKQRQALHVRLKDGTIRVGVRGVEKEKARG